jgi:hypothetical protein
VSKLDDIISAYMIDVDQHGFIAEEELPPAKRDIKALMLELVGEDELVHPLSSDPGLSLRPGYRNELRAELRASIEAL